MPGTRLTDKDAIADLRSFNALVEREGIPPTVREFQDECHLSSSSHARYRLLNLERHGYIEQRWRGAARSWQITDAGRKALKQEATE